METATYLRLPYIERLLKRVSETGDSEDETRIKASMIGNTFFIQLLGFLLAAVFFYFDEPLAAGIVLAGNTLGLISFAHFISTRKLYVVVPAALWLLLLGPFLLTLSLGGLVGSGIAIIFSAILIPSQAVALGRSHQAHRWYLAGLFVLILAGVLQAFTKQSNNLPQALIDPILILVNIAFVSGILFGAFSFLVRDRDRVHRLLEGEQELSERLLLNVLPGEVVPVLKAGGGTIAEHFESASVLFADIPGSMKLFTEENPETIVEWLNEIFSMFDRLVDKNGLEKIRTIGDEYMVASGVPTPKADHAHAIANLALEMRDDLLSLSPRRGRSIDFRIGINSGPLIAGVIGETKFHYDLWGHTVNVASRMESHGEEGRIQIAEGTYDLIKDDFHCKSRGLIRVKGAGELKTWFLSGKNSL